ncbi:hypothetical protein C0993_010326 [Termitomyces sp. T159_Od127]|nr:hypothetical protein C0993_010326 [Termitomyces sp. T159_Od127]
MNPHSSPQMKAESLEWIQNFATTPHMKRAFELGDFSALCFLAYPLENKDVLRVACDLMNWFFLYDDQSDLMTPPDAQKLAALVLNAISHPDNTGPAHECVVAEAIRQLWKLVSEVSSAASRGRLIKNIYNCTSAIVQQAQDRVLDHVRDVDEYLFLRRETVGATSAFVVLEFSLNLPDDIFEDAVIQRLNNACVDLILLSNDLYSYNVEQARGDGGHNLVTILMQHRHFTLTEAVKWIGDYALERVHSFLDDLNRVPFFGEEYQADVKRYLNGLGNFVRANDCWHFESGRYFGRDGLEIQRSRRVVLLPKQRLMPYFQY